MSWFSSVFGAGIGATAKGIGSLLKDGADVFTLSDEERMRMYSLETERMETLQKTDLGQIEVNKAEANHASWWVAGWRPGVGWICAVGLAYQFLFYPLVGPFLDHYLDVKLYEADIGDLLTLLTGMLGMSAIRTVEKVRNISRNNMKE